MARCFAASSRTDDLVLPRTFPPCLRWSTTVAIVLVLSACHRPAARSDSPAGIIEIAPSVSSVAPRSITMRDGEPVTLDIAGAHFDALNNTVRLGPVSITAVPSRAQGTRIAFSVPDRMPSGGAAAAVLWISGDYPLTITTARGTSAPVSITVTETR
jgi:hypothetical protein